MPRGATCGVLCASRQRENQEETMLGQTDDWRIALVCVRVFLGAGGNRDVLPGVHLVV
jgi:hypothetical protein